MASRGRVHPVLCGYHYVVARSHVEDVRRRSAPTPRERSMAAPVRRGRCGSTVLDIAARCDRELWVVQPGGRGTPVWFEYSVAGLATCVLRRPRLLPQPGGFEGVLAVEVDPFARDQAVANAVDASELLYDLDAALATDAGRSVKAQDHFVAFE